MNRSLFSIIIIMLVIFSTLTGKAQDILNGLYFGREPPGFIPKLFAPELINHLAHSSPTFSPDGTEIMWSTVSDDVGTRKIYRATYQNDEWSDPKVAAFSGHYHDDQPFISYDGRKLFFASKRPKTSGGDENLDLWYCMKKDNGWGKPQLVNDSIGMWTPSVTRNGTLYFIDIIGDAQTKGYKENAVGIFRSEFINGKYSTPELLPENINTKDFIDWTPFIAPDESYLIFSSHREGGYGSGDLYISYRDKNGNWDEPTNMGPAINTDKQERFPGVSPDGKYLFFTRWFGPPHYHDLYWIETKAVLPHLMNVPESKASSQHANSGDNVTTITVQADKPGAKINPAMWGIFFEDINFAADGGVYAELVKNRSFEFPEPMMGWSKISSGDMTGSIKILDRDPFNNANPHYLRIKTTGSNIGISNEAFRGMGIRANENYLFSAQVRATEGKPAWHIELVADNGRKLAEAKLDGFSTQWKKHSVTLRAASTELKAHLNIYVEGQGTIDMDMVSLFPEKTWKNRPGGLRADLVKMLADLKPGFIKFPGGFLTEGRSLDTRYQWKQTIGEPAERKLMINTFNRFPGRSTPDYFQSYGLGFFEYFQLCEDLGAEPQPVLSCGMAANFTGQMASLDKLEPYIQEVLDLIEFANGPVTSTWGKERAEMGHPQPFNLKMIRLGNEQQGQAYIERFEKFAEVLKTKHPEIQLIAGTGPDPDDDNFKYMSGKLRELNADIVDEHAHKQPEWFFNNATRYDSYDRSGPKVMVGEWAAHSEPGLINQNNRSNLKCALSEAAFMTGLERNSDVGAMSCYAPLFGHIDAWQWVPNLIWFDNLNVYGTPSYYVQQMFSCNRGDVVLPIDINASELYTQHLYTSAVRDNQTGEIILKVVNALPEPLETDVRLEGIKQVTGPATATVLTSANLSDENSFENPLKVSSKTASLSINGPKFRYTFPTNSFTALRIKAGKE